MAAVVSCSNIRCQQERRQLRKELERGRKNLITCIGLECVAETLFGEDLLKKVLPFYEDEEEKNDVQDWNMFQECSLCSARHLLVSESLARHKQYIDNMRVANNDQKPFVYLEYMHPDILREADLFSISESASQPPSHPPTPLPTQVSLETGSPQPLDLSKRSNSPDITQNGKKDSFLRVPSVKSAGHPGEVRRGRPPFKSSYNSTYTEADLRQAIRDVRSGKLGTRRAAILYGIPRSTIRNHLNKPSVWKDDIQPKSPKETSNSNTLGEMLDKQPVDDDSMESARTDEKEWNGVSKEMEDAEDSESGVPSSEVNNHKDRELRSKLTDNSSAADLEDVDPVTKLRNFLKEKPDPEAICKRRLTMGELMNDSTYAGVTEALAESDGSLKNKRGSLTYANEIKFPFPPNVFRQLIEQRVTEKQEMKERGSNSSTPLKVPTYKPLNPLASQSDSAEKSKPSLLKDFGMRKNSFGSDIGANSSKMSSLHFLPDDCYAKRKSDDGDKPSKQSRPKRGRYRCYDRDNLVQAVEAVQRGEMTVTRAGNVFGVPHSTLEYKVKERHLQRPSKRASRRHRDFSMDGSSSSSSPPPPSLTPSKSVPSGLSTSPTLSASPSLVSSMSSSSLLDRNISWSPSDRPRLVPSILRKNRSQSMSSMSSGMFASLLDRPPLVTVANMDEARRFQEVMSALRGSGSSSRGLDSASGRSADPSDCFIVEEVNPTPDSQPRSLRDLFDRHSFRHEKYLAEYGPLSTVSFDSAFKSASNLSSDSSLSSFLHKESATQNPSAKPDSDTALQPSAIKTDTSAIYQQSLSTTIDTALRNIMNAFHKGTSSEQEDKEDAKSSSASATTDKKLSDDKKEASGSSDNGKFVPNEDELKSQEFKAKLRRSFEKTARDIGHDMVLFDDNSTASDHSHGEGSELRLHKRLKSSDSFLK